MFAPEIIVSSIWVKSFSCFFLGMVLLFQGFGHFLLSNDRVKLFILIPGTQYLVILYTIVSYDQNHNTGPYWECCQLVHKLMQHWPYILYFLFFLKKSLYGKVSLISFLLIEHGDVKALSMVFLPYFLKYIIKIYILYFTE